MHNKDQNFFKTYQAQNKLRFVTATALFDGHDASINIIRRLLQAKGVEVIHLGHNRTAQEVADAAIQEDVQGVAISSYQGGHMEYFKFVRQLLDQNGGDQIKIFGGGGGVITLEEIAYLDKENIAKIYSPEDGQKLGLEGMIGHMIHESDFEYKAWEKMNQHTQSKISRGLTLLENQPLNYKKIVQEMELPTKANQKIVLGITGTGGAGKSSLLDELLLRFIHDFPKIKIGVICVDPSKKKTGGALLGDRIRINACSYKNIFLRSMASRGSGKEIAQVTSHALKILQTQDFDILIVETSGIGQGDTGILEVSDLSLYVMTPEYGASTQLEKIDMLDFADLIAVNKFERRQGPDSIRDIKTTLRRSRFHGQNPSSGYPVYGTIASRYNDDGCNGLYQNLVSLLKSKGAPLSKDISQHRSYKKESSKRESLIATHKESYLSDIAQTIRSYHKSRKLQVQHIKTLEALELAYQCLGEKHPEKEQDLLYFRKEIEELEKAIPNPLKQELDSWKEKSEKYKSGTFTYQVRNKELKVQSTFETLSHQHLPIVCLPNFTNKSELANFLLKENLPGGFPYASGIFPFRRKGEDPKRQFAGEGGPKRTNTRFHYLSKNDQAKRLSTAFDSVTLYGADPSKRPDIYGKIGESGVSIAHLDDMKALFKGFDLCSPNTSVSMTINGPAPIILAMFFNTAIDQQIELFQTEKKRLPTPDEHKKIHDDTLKVVRGTVQADILKEDQAQNTCIFSTEFALKIMGDIQEFFINKSVRNYYGVSISGYHIAEAGANPITQLAFTLANGFTYVEYYLSRGFSINDFAPNLSFFFSNGVDAEYAVLGRVARRIWAIAMKNLYQASEKAQKLKYHIQTSGRSLHAQEMDFNDIRTTLQSLLALYDNCNSLHTNAYDEAVTTPTEDSVRRAMAIQLIINHEFGPNKCENINQGSFFIEELTDLVEEEVLKEFDRISARGGVLGAMETQYQRSKIQEESMHYEHLKHSGSLPIIGVNTFLNPKAMASDASREETELIRASYEEKDAQLQRLTKFIKIGEDKKQAALQKLTEAAIAGENIFSELMHTVRYCSLGEISEVLYKVGGRYRRSM